MSLSEHQKERQQQERWLPFDGAAPASDPGRDPGSTTLKGVLAAQLKLLSLEGPQAVCR